MCLRVDSTEGLVRPPPRNYRVAVGILNLNNHYAGVITGTPDGKTRVIDYVQITHTIEEQEGLIVGECNSDDGPEFNFVHFGPRVVNLLIGAIFADNNRAGTELKFILLCAGQSVAAESGFVERAAERDSALVRYIKERGHSLRRLEHYGVQYPLRFVGTDQVATSQELMGFDMSSLLDTMLFDRISEILRGNVGSFTESLEAVNP